MRLNIIQDDHTSIDKHQKSSNNNYSNAKISERDPQTIIITPRNDSNAKKAFVKKIKQNLFPLDTIKGAIPLEKLLEKVNNLPKREINIFSCSPEHINMLNIHNSLCASLDKMNMTKPTGIQTQAIQTMLSYMPDAIKQVKPFTMYDYHQFLSRDSQLIPDWMMRSPTGSGKSLAYLIPIIHTLACLCQSTSTDNHSKDYFSCNNGSIDQESNTQYHNMNRSSGTFAIIITPTRELAIQLCELTSKLLNFPRYDVNGNLVERPRWITPGAFLSGVSRDREKARLRAGVSIVFTTPGRLLDHLENTKSWLLRNLGWVILEEADRFQEPHFSECLSKCWHLISERTFSQRSWQLVLVSATLSYTPTNEDTFASLKLRIPHLIEPLPESQDSIDNASISINDKLIQYLLQVPIKMRHLALISIIKHWKNFRLNNTDSRMIIFFTSCDSVDYYFRLLASIFNTIIDSSSISRSDSLILYRFHGKLDAVQRSSIMKQYCGKGDDDALKIFLTTNLSSRGLDFPKISLIIQYDLPFDSIDYVHKIGRTARMELLGTCILFALPHERQVILQVIGKKLSESKCSWEIMELDLVKVLSGSDKPLSKDANDSVEIGTISENLRKELLVIQNEIEENVKLHFHELARNAFLASVKAYTSYPKELKEAGIHQRALHLGHYARSFGLRDPPSKIAKDSIEGISRISSKKDNESLSKLLSEKRPRSLNTSEFDSGEFKVLKRKKIA